MGFTTQRQNDQPYLRELRLFVEEICCNLLRLRYASEKGIEPQDVRIRQECSLGIPDGFADIRIDIAGTPPQYLEIDYGYSPEQSLASLTRKYGPAVALEDGSKLVVIIDAKLAESWKDIAAQLRSKLSPKLEFEVWDEAKLLALLKDSFGVEVDCICERNIADLRHAVDNAEGRHAFEETWAGDNLQSTLTWHYGFWELKRLRQNYRMTSSTMLPPGSYPKVVTVMADLCGFSGYVKETKEDGVIRHCLTTFYSKARSAILNTGGMMYQFVGDEAIGLFGLPDQPDNYLEAAFDCARALVDIGNSVSRKWQRELDSVQKTHGVHIGICMGAMQIVSLRPFSRTHISGIGDVINLAARLLADAGPGQIVASNAYYQALVPDYQAAFRESAPVEAKNIGTVLAWRADLNNPLPAGAPASPQSP
jgi:adenylate cyclase